MKAITIATLLFLVGAAYAVQIGHGHQGYGYQDLGRHLTAHDYYSVPKYTYNYGVADKVTGDQKSAGEVREGEYVKGYYQLVQPDGVLRTVTYISSPKTGFQAQVINKGKALHPALYGKSHGYGSYGGYGDLGREIGGYGSYGGRGLGGRGGNVIG